MSQRCIIRFVKSLFEFSAQQKATSTAFMEMAAGGMLTTLVLKKALIRLAFDRNESPVDRMMRMTHMATLVVALILELD
jgi:hypothetical protein